MALVEGNEKQPFPGLLPGVFRAFFEDFDWEFCRGVFRGFCAARRYDRR